MSLAVNMTTSGPALRFLTQVTQSLQSGALNQRVGGVAQRLVKQHLTRLIASRPNRLGGKSTRFYEKAANATTFTATPSGVLITIAKQGMRQRFSGGVITPVNAKYLTIPATPAAHGKRAGGFGDLKFAIVPGRGPALVRTSDVFKATGKVRKDGTRKQQRVASAGEVVFWLRKRITQRPDPTVIPNAQDFTAAISADLDVWRNTLAARAQAA